MLQGLGTLAGAFAVLIAALIGGSTFRSWRRQQIMQRQIPLAERILIAAFEARERLQEVRSPLISGNEQDIARNSILNNGLDISKFDEKRKSKVVIAQVYHERLNKHSDFWIDLQSCKASAYAYFGLETVNDIDKILFSVSSVRTAAESTADDDESNAEFSKYLRQTLSFSRIGGDVDQLGKEVEEAVISIENRLKPILAESASETQKLLREALRIAVENTIVVTVPWPLNRLIP